MFIYLASQSPRRRQLLEQLGVRYELLLPDEGEDTETIEEVLRGEAPARYVQRVTGLKLEAAMERLKPSASPGVKPAATMEICITCSWNTGTPSVRPSASLSASLG